MSRSNGPATQPGARPPQRTAPQPGYEQDPASWGAQAQGRWPQQPAPYPQPHPAAPYPAAQHPTAQPVGTHPAAYVPPADPRTQPPGYHYAPAAEGHDPYSRPTLGGRETTAPPAAHAQSFAPQFDAYAPPPAAGYGGQAYGQPSPQPYAPPAYDAGPPAGLSSLGRAPAPMPELPPYPPTPDLRGSQYEPHGGDPQAYDQWGHPVAPAAPDPRGYDFGGYQPAPVSEPQHHRDMPSLEPSLGDGGTSDGPYDPYSGQPLQPGYHHHQPPQGMHAPYEAPPLHPHPGQHDQVPRGSQIEPAFQGDTHEEAGEYELDEPRSGRRWALMAASLAGAIAIGAGLTYGYKTIVGPGKNVTTPLVKNTATPSKEKPAVPGGKQFAHTDSKIMGRLNDQSPAASAASESDANGTRKVQTLVVGRDGSIAPPPAIEPARVAAAQPAAAVSVPGMTIVDGFGGRPPAAALAPPQPQPAPAAVQTPARPVVVTPPAAAAPPAPSRPVVTAKAEPEAVAPKAAAPKVAVPKKPAATTAAAPSSGGANGYVAVLASVPASQKSSMDALKQFADMQQKYGAALANKTPEVREANLGDKGTYHRLLVGPPGSREQAGQLCTQLKSQGYGSCWVTAY